MRYYGAILTAMFVALIATSCSAERPIAPEQAVIVHFKYSSTDLKPLFVLEDELEQAMVAAGVGEFDGYEVAAGGGDTYLYMYGQMPIGSLMQ